MSSLIIKKKKEEVSKLWLVQMAILADLTLHILIPAPNGQGIFLENQVGFGINVFSLEDNSSSYYPFSIDNNYHSSQFKQIAKMPLAIAHVTITCAFSLQKTNRRQPMVDIETN